MQIKILDNGEGGNRENKIPVGLVSDSKLLPFDSVSSTIDEYSQYIKEKDNSNIFRLIVTIDPICSNVLFNNVSEIVYKEGSDECLFFGHYKSDGYGIDNTVKLSEHTNEPFYQYCIKKGLYSYDTLNREDVIRDTGFSHKDVGPFVYHCGYDIFNNHMLRHKEFHVVTKMNSSISSTDKRSFNTLSDYVRDNDGNIVMENRVKKSGDKIDSTETFKTHAYMYDTVYSFQKSITENLVERDGWIGFVNPCNLNVPNYESSSSGWVSINKCMNNNKAGEFIDMYPDRSLYSFIPKYNKYRNRVENNWDYCLTYPYKSDDTHEIVSELAEESIKGIRCVANDRVYDSNRNRLLNDGDLITFRTDINHTLKEGDEISITLITPYNEFYIPNRVSIESVGFNGSDYTHYFTIRLSAIYDIMEEAIDNAGDESKIHARIRKCEGGKECKYYVRYFRKIPNFKNTNIYNKNYLTEDEIVEYGKKGFSSSISKVAFENTIYGDRKAQIIFNDDIDVSCLRDNLGRELTTVYLTIVKRNKGYEKWYPENYDTTPMDTSSEDIEFSHCFGKVTAGFNLPDYVDDYNVRKIHNLKKTPLLGTCILKVPKSPNNLEKSYHSVGENYGITIEKDEALEDNAFFGDVVEFSEYNFNETVLEDVYFRFNTAQREYEGYSFSRGTGGDTNIGEYANMYHDEIITDDYDFDSSFECRETRYNEINYEHTGKDTYRNSYPVNIMPEGYYYKAHYPIELRKLKDSPEQGSHIRIDYNDSVEYGSMIKMVTTQNFHIEIGDTLYLYNKENPSERLTGIAYSVDGKDYIDITFKVYDGENVVVAEKGLDDNGNIVLTLINEGNDVTTQIRDLDDYTVYRKNPLMPDFAYDMRDGTGRYIWRDVKSTTEILSGDSLYDSVFINGAHYRQENIQFYLRRQDPLGINGLSKVNGQPAKIGQFIIGGEYKEISKNVYVPEEESTC